MQLLTIIPNSLQCCKKGGRHGDQADVKVAQCLASTVGLQGASTQVHGVVHLLTVQHDALQVNAYDLVGALDMLAQLESEQTGQRKQYLQVYPYCFICRLQSCNVTTRLVC